MNNKYFDKFIEMMNEAHCEAEVETIYNRCCDSCKQVSIYLQRTRLRGNVGKRQRNPEVER